MWHRCLLLSTGTRPGDPFGSAIFNFVMSRVLRRQAAAFRRGSLRVLLGVGFGPCLLAILLPPWSTFLRLPSLTILCAALQLQLLRILLPKLHAVPNSNELSSPAILFNLIILLVCPWDVLANCSHCCLPRERSQTPIHRVGRLLLPLLETGFFRARLIISIWVAFFKDPKCYLRHELRVRGAQLKFAAAPL